MRKNGNKPMKLPNGFGSIKYLGTGRRKPYMASPPLLKNAAYSGTPKPIGYAATWEEAYELLTLYHLTKKGSLPSSTTPPVSPLFSEIYEQFFVEKFHSNHSRSYASSTKRAIVAAYRNCHTLHNLPISQLTYDDLQNVVNSCPLKHASIELIIHFLKQLYRFMLKHELITKNPALYLYNPKPEDDECGEAFSEEEIQTLLRYADDETAQMLLIMIYSGFRISAYTQIEVNLEERYFKGGIKTVAGKDRIVPIHTFIYPYVAKRCVSGSSVNLLGCSPQTFRRRMYKKLYLWGISISPGGKKHTPHDCRHTFSTLCEKYHISPYDHKRLMGHSFGQNITNGKYVHRTLEDLKFELAKIPSPQ